MLGGNEWDAYRDMVSDPHGRLSASLLLLLLSYSQMLTAWNFLMLIRPFTYFIISDVFIKHCDKGTLWKHLYWLHHQKQAMHCICFIFSKTIHYLYHCTGSFKQAYSARCQVRFDVAQLPLICEQGIPLCPGRPMA